MSTIFAVSSGAPPAAIAVLRVTGPDALAVARALTDSLPRPRQAGLRALRDEMGRLLDRALVLVFPGPDSATGEDLVEFHLHGGRAVVAAVTANLASRPGCRAAEPGEFTRRALANGRIDLAEAEALGDLLAAQTEGQRIAALDAAEGMVSTRVAGWLDRLSVLSAQIEADLDFSDEDDVATGNAGVATIVLEMAALAREMGEVLSEPPVDRLHHGVRVVLAGPPNSGKSTLFNLLAQREAAIVSPTAGTTRDVIEAAIVRDGVAYILVDTAGLAELSTDAIELIGIDRAGQAIIAADVLLWLGDGPPPRDDAVWVHARADLPGRNVHPVGPVLTTAKDRQESISEVWGAIHGRAASLLPREGVLALNQRQRASAKVAYEALCVTGDDALIVAEHLRIARSALASMLGLDATDAMLDALFSRFCIGK